MLVYKYLDLNIDFLFTLIKDESDPQSYAGVIDNLKLDSKHVKIHD